MSVPDAVALFTFSSVDAAPPWQVVNDGVMGGRSSSTLQWTEEGTVVFRGTVSLEQGGGFASVRAPVDFHDLSAFDGLALRLRGDGQHYTLALYNESPPRSIAYRTSFATEAEAWQTIQIPFADLAPSFRGRPVPDAPPFEASRVQALSLLIADEQAGPFRLEVAWVRAVQLGAA
ncbi:MAG: CIA30 family protein [Bacteroidetes bacterium]|jgi:monofunctional biosynthetic peptidoglycan transglycosylase|nr:CIA30 family protein [Bacteroidota bacterium]